MTANSVRLHANPLLALGSRIRHWPMVGQVDTPEGYTRVMLPYLVLARDGENAWSSLEGAGLIRLVESWPFTLDGLRPCALPPGWQLERLYSDTSELCDAAGRKIANVYIFKNRRGRVESSYFRLLPRYQARATYVGDYETVGDVFDNDVLDQHGMPTRIFRSDVFYGGYSSSSRTREATAVGRATNWLNENHPDWRRFEYGRTWETAATTV